MKNVQRDMVHVERLTWSTVDLAALVVEVGGIVAAVWLTIHSLRAACAPDADGLEALGAFWGVGFFGLLAPGFICTLCGLLLRNVKALISGRVLICLCVLGWPPIPPTILGFGVMMLVPWSC